MKRFPPWPMRSCRKKTGPGEASLIYNARIRTTGNLGLLVGKAIEDDHDHEHDFGEDAGFTCSVLVLVVVFGLMVGLLHAKSLHCVS